MPLSIRCSKFDQGMSLGSESQGPVRLGPVRYIGRSALAELDVGLSCAVFLARLHGDSDVVSKAVETSVEPF